MMNYEIKNDLNSFVQLWHLLERTRALLGQQGKRFCIRNVLQSWYRQGVIDWLGVNLQLMNKTQLHAESMDEYIWEICRLCNYEGLLALPPPSLHPRVHRELIRAVTAKLLGIGMRQVNLHALDAAYSQVYPHSTPLNVNKRKRMVDKCQITNNK